MRAHLIIDLETGALELHTDTSPKPPVAVRGKDKKKRKKVRSASVMTNVTSIKKGDLID